MAVMTTEVALAGNAGGVRQAGQFRDRQRVKLGADHHAGAGVAAMIDCGDAVAAKAGQQPVGADRVQGGQDVLAAVFAALPDTSGAR